MRVLYLTGRENALYNRHRNLVAGVHATEFFASDARWAKLGRRVMRSVPFGSVGPFFADWIGRAHEFDVILLTGTLHSQPIGDALIRRGLRDRLVHWFMNPITPADRIERLLAQDVPIVTFDPRDAEQYGLRLETTYYFSTLVPESATTPGPTGADVFFVGGDKGRLGQLTQLRQHFDALGLSSDFHITDTGHAKRSPSHAFSPPIPYAEVVRRIQNSRCLLDIVQAGQSGLTQRPMEALFHQRKLITNETTLAAQDFYRKENIFILGRDDPAGLPAFVRSPYQPVDPALRARYDFRNWMARVAAGVAPSGEPRP
jgi:hypothetical protein